MTTSQVAIFNLAESAKREQHLEAFIRRDLKTLKRLSKLNKRFRNVKSGKLKGIAK